MDAQTISLQQEGDRALTRRQLLAGAGTLAAGAVGLGLLETASASAQDVQASASAQQFKAAMRKLWEDHITWTRLYIVSFIGGLPDQTATLHRLLRNQVDIGNAVKPYYGAAAGNRLTALLRQHILGAGAILVAAKAGNTAQVQAASRAWYVNANQIAAFLHSANPQHWPLAALRQMMHSHLTLTLNEAVAQLKGNYAASVADYDKVHREILMMADALSSGIIAQFPQRFM